MLLSDMDSPSETMIKAMNDGIVTMSEYTIYLMGYHSGYRDRQKEVMEAIING